MSLKLASGSYDNSIKFWDPSTGTYNNNEVIKLNSAPNKIEITEDKTKIIVGMNNSVKVYHLKKIDQPPRSYDTDFKGNVVAIGCFYKRPNLIYTGCEDGCIKIFDIRTKNVELSFKHTKPINCAALHPNEGSIVTGD